MGKIVAGIGTSHVPSIGVAYDKGEQKTDSWSPLFSAYEPVQEWLAELKPDVAIIAYNDHGCASFSTNTLLLPLAQLMNIQLETKDLAKGHCRRCQEIQRSPGIFASSSSTTNSTLPSAKN